MGLFSLNLCPDKDQCWLVFQPKLSTQLASFFLVLDRSKPVGIHPHGNPGDSPVFDAAIDQLIIDRGAHRNHPIQLPDHLPTLARPTQDSPEPRFVAQFLSVSCREYDRRQPRLMSLIGRFHCLVEGDQPVKYVVVFRMCFHPFRGVAQKGQLAEQAVGTFDVVLLDGTVPAEAGLCCRGLV